jgi:hypothetical protein
VSPATLAPQFKLKDCLKLPTTSVSVWIELHPSTPHPISGFTQQWPLGLLGDAYKKLTLIRDRITLADPGGVAIAHLLDDTLSHAYKDVGGAYHGI